MNIGDSLKYARVRNKLNQAELAIKLKVSQAYISQIENNERYPSLNMLRRFNLELGTRFKLKETTVIFIKIDSLNQLERQELDNYLDFIISKRSK